MQKTLLFRGQNIDYVVRGAGLPVMLIHGFTEDRRIWEELPLLKEGKYKWILPDLPGTGESSYNEALSGLPDFAEAIRSVLIAEKIESAVIIGHSMGGYISLAFAEKYPDMVRALGLFHSSAYADSAERKETRDKNIRFIEKNGSEPFVEQSIPGLYSASYKTEYPEKILEQIRRYANFSPNSLVQYLNAMKKRSDTSGVLKSISRPVLFILGEEDKAVPLKDGLEQCHLPVISYIHILSRTAHMGMIEQTARCNTLVDQFLADIPL